MLALSTNIDQVKHTTCTVMTELGVRLQILAAIHYLCFYHTVGDKNNELLKWLSTTLKCAQLFRSRTALIHSNKVY